MTSLDRRLTKLAVIGVVMMAIGLSACGRRGPLEPPPNAAATTGNYYGATHPAQVTAGEDKSDKPFFLDFLL